jgi:hypothetical protein
MADLRATSQNGGWSQVDDAVYFKVAGTNGAYRLRESTWLNH